MFVGLAVGSVPAAKLVIAADRAIREVRCFRNPHVHSPGLYRPVVGYILLTFVVGVPLLGSVGARGVHGHGRGDARLHGPGENRLRGGLGVVSAFRLASFWVIVATTIISFRGVIAEVVACNHGLRWRWAKYGTRALVGREIRHSRRVDRHATARRLAVWRVPRDPARRPGTRVDRGRITDYPQLADTIQATTQDVVAAERQRQLAAGK